MSHPALLRWLAVGGSLSARLQRVSSAFHVRRQRQGQHALSRADRQLLGQSTRAAALPCGHGWQREVLLQDGAMPLVAARSFALRSATRAAWRAVQGLGQRPLADLLFATRRVERQPLAFRCIRPTEAMGRALRRRLSASLAGGPADARLAEPALTPHQRLWARRSVFVRRGQPLVVEEVFLPALAGRSAPGRLAWRGAHPTPGLRGQACRARSTRS